MAIFFAIGVVGLWPALTKAQPTFAGTSSSLTLTHTDDLSAMSPNVFSTSPSPIPVPTPPFQMNHTFTAGSGDDTSSTLGVAGVDELTSAIEMGIGLTSGTGVTQTNVPGHFYIGASEVDIAATYTWTLGSSGFPLPGHFPGITYAFALGGTVGTGGYAEFEINMKFFDTAGAAPVQVGSLGLNALFNTPGPFTQLESGAVLLNGGNPLPKNSTFQMVGTIDFLAKNDESPSNINITSDGQFGSADFANLDDIPEPGCCGLAFVFAAGALTRRNRRITI
jgi:hypothetical protein